MNYKNLEELIENGISLWKGKGQEVNFGENEIVSFVKEKVNFT